MPALPRLAPGQLLVVCFAVAIFVGTLGLLLPWVTVAGVRNNSWTDALFMATSALCVTGLGVRDLADYTWFGQLWILLLIQAGGLGIITFAKLALINQRRELRIGDRDLVDTAFGHVRWVTPREVLRQTVVFTTCCELVGMALLAPRFIADHGWGEGLWASMFHAVSAFCNAGFSLWRDNLCQYRDDALVNCVVMALIVLGGIGFVVVAEAVTWFQRRRLRLPTRMSLHSRTVLITTGALIIVGWVGFAALEWFNPLPDGSRGDLLPSLFLSITARTAGYNTIPLDSLCHPSLLLMILLMAVGGSPGSTAGGIKTTTLATLLALLRARIRGREDAEFQGRAIGSESVNRAISTTCAMMVLIAVGVAALELAEVGVTSHRTQASHFIDHLFEVVSALGTVGLSTGITAGLGTGGRIIIVLCMFAGRVGPLLLADSFVARGRRLPYQLPREDVVIG